MKVLRPLSECLSQTIQVLDRFWNGSLAEIKRVSESTDDRVSGSLPDIDTTLEELRNLDNDLRKMVEWYGDIANRVSFSCEPIRPLPPVWLISAYMNSSTSK
jgi:hypothetical protein